MAYTVVFISELSNKKNKTPEFSGGETSIYSAVAVPVAWNRAGQKSPAGKNFAKLIIHEGCGRVCVDSRNT